MAAFAAEHLKPYGFEFVQIDDSWQAGVSKNGPKRNFTTHAEKGPYPSGMKPTAEHVKKQGLSPGIWFMPFAGTCYDPFFQDHQDWFVKNAKGEPYETDGDRFEPPLAQGSTRDEELEAVPGTDRAVVLDEDARALGEGHVPAAVARPGLALAVLHAARRDGDRPPLAAAPDLDGEDALGPDPCGVRVHRRARTSCPREPGPCDTCGNDRHRSQKKDDAGHPSLTVCQVRASSRSQTDARRRAQPAAPELF